MGGVAVLAVTVISALAMFPVSNLLRDRSGSNTRAATIIQRKLDQVRSLKAAEITGTRLRTLGFVDANATGAGNSYSFTQADNLAQQLQGATGTLALVNPGTDLVEARVTLSWMGMRGRSSTTTAVTYVADKSAWREP